MPRKKHEEHVNHERWLVSYADFITLLFAFFVVMFAVSQVDSKRVGRFTQEFQKAVGIEVFPDGGAGLMAGEKASVPSHDDGRSDNVLPDELEGLRSDLDSMREKNGDLQGLQIVRRKNELILRLPEAIFYERGDDRVKDPAVKMLRVLTPQLTKRRIEVRVEGHTDDRPINTSRFRSNWDLSTARATSVVDKLAAEGMPGERLVAAGYGEFRPIAPNNTDDGRRQNRRVDLVVTQVSVHHDADVAAPHEGAAAATMPAASASPTASGETDHGTAREREAPPKAAVPAARAPADPHEGH